MSIVVNAYESTLYVSAYTNKPHCSSNLQLFRIMFSYLNIGQLRFFYTGRDYYLGYMKSACNFQ